MAYPDEPSHTIKAAAVARGQFAVQEGQSFGHGVHVQVPSYIANLSAQTCTAFKRDVTAACAPAVPMDDNYLTIGVTSAGLYNPMYYWVVGLPSLFLTGAPAIIGMRIASALLCTAFLAAGLTALTKLRNPKWPVAAALVAITPMVLFLCSGINPNSLEVAATMAAFCGLLVCLESSARLPEVKPAIATVGVSVAVLANTRNVSLVWLLDCHRGRRGVLWVPEPGPAAPEPGRTGNCGFDVDWRGIRPSLDCPDALCPGVNCRRSRWYYKPRSWC